MTTEALIGSGTLVELSDGNSPNSFVTLAEVGDLAIPSDQVAQIKATHMQSGRREEYISGLIDGTDGTIPINWIPGNDTDDLIQATIASGEQRNIRFTYPNLVTETFLCIVTGYTRNAPVGDKMAGTITIKKSGDATFGVTN